MACCGKGKLKIPKEQQDLINKINSNQNSNSTPSNYSVVKSNRSRPGTIAKECPKCSTKTIGTVCPVCSTIIP
jgi:hypothetical protein